jgi:flavin-dependent dehydrogenase
VSGPDVDILVVGAGPIGLGAAVMANQAGFSVAVAERRADPVDKACGEGLMPSAVLALAALGVDPDGRAFRGIRYVAADGTRSAQALFPNGTGRGVRRTVLHTAMRQRVAALDVGRLDLDIRQVRQDPTGVQAGGVRARWLLAADGLHSGIRRQLDLQLPAQPRPRYGLRRHFQLAPWTDLVEVHWTQDAEAYVTPVGPDEVGVAVLTEVRGRPFGEWLERFPALRDRLRCSSPCTAVLGAGPLEQSSSRRVAGRVLLVGDAAGYVDALTGEGISVGLAQASAAVDCLRRGRPQDYERAWRVATRRSRVLTRAVLFAAHHEALRRRLVPAASAAPALFAAAVRALA